MQLATQVRLVPQVIPAQQAQQARLAIPVRLDLPAQLVILVPQDPKAVLDLPVPRVHKEIPAIRDLQGPVA